MREQQDLASAVRELWLSGHTHFRLFVESTIKKLLTPSTTTTTTTTTTSFQPSISIRPESMRLLAAMLHPFPDTPTPTITPTQAHLHTQSLALDLLLSSSLEDLIPLPELASSTLKLLDYPKDLFPSTRHKALCLLERMSRISSWRTTVFYCKGLQRLLCLLCEDDYNTTSPGALVQSTLGTGAGGHHHRPRTSHPDTAGAATASRPPGSDSDPDPALVALLLAYVDWIVQDLSGADTLSVQRATRALHLVSSTSSGADQIHRAASAPEVVSRLLNHLNQVSSDDLIKEHAAGALANLARASKFKDAIKAMGGVAQIIPLLLSANNGSRLNACRALRTLSDDPDCLQQIKQYPLAGSFGLDPVFGQSIVGVATR